MDTAGLIAIGAAGGLVLVVALVDIFVTIFNYDGFTFVTARVHHLTWRALRRFSGVLPVHVRHSFLSLGAAAMLPLTLAWWLAIEISALAMMYLPGIAGGYFTLGDHVQPEIGSAYYLSAGAITSLTFGDLLARTGAYQALVVIETVIGLATFTLALTYVLTALDTLTNLNRLYGRVRRHAIEPNQPETILARYFHGGQPAELGSLLQSLAEDLQAYDEGLRRYPIVFYFHTRRLQRSTPTVFDELGDLIELLRWGLPAGQPLTDNPYLLALAAEYTTTVRRLQRSFVGPEDLEMPDAAEPAAMADGECGPEAAYAGEFIQMRHRASRAAGLPTEPSDRAYDRYLAWLPFHHRRSVFLRRRGGPRLHVNHGEEGQQNE